MYVHHRCAVITLNRCGGQLSQECVTNFLFNIAAKFYHVWSTFCKVILKVKNALFTTHSVELKSKTTSLFRPACQVAAHHGARTSDNVVLVEFARVAATEAKSAASDCISFGYEYQ